MLSEGWNGHIHLEGWDFISEGWDGNDISSDEGYDY